MNARYMTLLMDLRDQISRELDAVQVGDPPIPGMPAAIARVQAARADYAASLNER